MSDARWRRVLDWAAYRRANPAWDAAERDYRLALAGSIRALVDAAAAGEPIAELVRSLYATMRKRRVPQVAVGRHMAELKRWAEEDEDGLALAIRPFADPEVAPEERVARFVESATERVVPDEVPAFGLAIGSLLNFGTAPDRLPIMRLAAFNGLEHLLGDEPGPASPEETYRRHLAFAERMHEALAKDGIPVRDMTDTEALVLIAWEDRDFWLEQGDARRLRKRAPEHYLAACVVYRDEAPYLPEWLEFHRLVGFERFYLYDNVSEDEHREVLAPYIEEGLVVLHDWPMPYVPGQREAYNHCVATHGEEARWIGFFDVDEFLFSPTYRPVPEILADYERWPGVVVNAPRFGTSGHRTKPDGLVIENYVTHMQLDSDRTVKSIVDPAAAKESKGAHVFDYLRGSAVDENGYPVHHGATKVPSFERLRVNHYYWKSVEELVERQTGRTAGPGRAWRVPPTAEEFLRFEAEHGVRDETILHYLEPVREALARRTFSR